MKGLERISLLYVVRRKRFGNYVSLCRSTACQLSHNYFKKEEVDVPSPYMWSVVDVRSPPRTSIVLVILLGTCRYQDLLNQLRAVRPEKK
jgi:hypothetical protein